MCAGNKRWGPYMILESKKIIRALQIDLDLIIRISGSLNLDFRVSRSERKREGSELFLLTKTINGLPLFF